VTIFVTATDFTKYFDTKIEDKFKAMNENDKIYKDRLDTLNSILIELNKNIISLTKDDYPEID